MICPFCSHPHTRVLETRDTSPEKTRRRRECSNCKKRFTTYEQIELTNTIVVKKSGVKESYDHNKLVKSLRVACRKRPISERRIEEIANDIEAELRSMNAKEIPSRDVGKLVMKRLKQEDRVAYVRYASVYKEFEDVSNFKQVLDSLQ